MQQPEFSHSTGVSRHGWFCGSTTESVTAHYRDKPRLSDEVLAEISGKVGHYALIRAGRIPTVVRGFDAVRIDGGGAAPTDADVRVRQAPSQRRPRPL